MNTLAPTLKTVNGKTASFKTVDTGWGVYYTGSLDAKDNRDHLNRVSQYLRKYADDGQETMLEQSMGSLGYTYLRDRVPKLMPHLVGFQLIDKNDDRTRAFGAFAFRMNQRWFVVPIVFSRGDLKGHEILWVKAEDLFVPLREGWINYFQQNRTASLGKPGPSSRSAYASDVPDLSRMIRPGGGGYGKNAHWVEGCLPMLAALQQKSPNFLRDYQVPGVDELCRGHAKVAYAVGSIAARLPVYKEGLDAHYPTLAGELHDLAFGKLGVEVESTDTEDVKEIDVDEAPAMKSTPPAKLRAYFREDIEAAPEAIPDSVKEKAMTEGVGVIDERSDDDLAVVVDPTTSYQNPTTNGIYDLLIGDGKTAECLIVAPRSYEPEYRVAVENNGSRIWRGKAAEMWTCGVGDDSDWLAAVEKLSRAKSALGSESYDRYLLIAPNGECLEIGGGEKIAGDEYAVYIDDSPPSNSLSRPGGFCGGSGATRLHLGGNVRGIRKFGNDYLAGDEVRAVKLGKVERLPSRLIDRALGVLKGMTPLSVRKTANDNYLIEFGEGRFSNRIETTNAATAKVGLMGLLHFSKEAADELIDEASLAGRRVVFQSPGSPPAVWFSKNAIDLMSPPGAEAPPFPPDQMGLEAVGRGYMPAQYASREFVDVPGLMGNGQEMELDYLQQADTDQAISVAQQGAAMGDKELMDFGTLAAMAKIRGVKNYVDGYWRKIVDGMDAFGRILLLMYLHPDDFTEEYGSHGLPELEDALQNAFELAGDVALELAEKTLKPLGDSEQPIDLAAEN